MAATFLDPTSFTSYNQDSPQLSGAITVSWGPVSVSGANQWNVLGCLHYHQVKDRARYPAVGPMFLVTVKQTSRYVKVDQITTDFNVGAVKGATRFQPECSTV